MIMKHLTLPAVALIVLASGAAVVLGTGKSVAESHAASDTAAASQNGDTMEKAAEAGEIVEMVMGAEDAPVTVIEYASFTCPHCANFHMNQGKQLKSEYIDTGKVRFIYRDVYFDRVGLWAAMLARCESDRFFGITDMLYSKQSEWLASSDPVVLAGSLRKMGKIAGLSEERVDACMQDADKAKALVDWFETNAEADNIEATPTVLVDGVKLDGNSWNAIKEAIDAKLEG
ncbi:DsbA family protein [Rhodobacteraceae bacterium LMO-12]|jgi:protein-disulfide isomerase|nr:DsbA family protein [Rhodobacteraceae bacterium LMO-JJ12]